MDHLPPLPDSRVDAPPGGVDPVRVKVLIVDDDERNAFAAVQALEELGHELVVARSGEEALRRVLVDDYAVILLDLHMPGMDGYETASLIRARRKTSRTPIVFCTAIFREEAHVFQAYSAGAVDVVFKPLDAFILRSKVQVFADLYSKTAEMEREADHRRRLEVENARVREEKLKAERQLAHAQKMEAVGQLTGGIAHDFNNLLTVVLGNVDLISRKLEPGSREERQLSAVRHAAERGRSLTRQLLAFSRRQQLSPASVDVNELLHEFLPLLRQAVGDAVTIEAPAPDEPLCIHVDAVQLESALLNLAVNARDAMPEGGLLTITARGVDSLEITPPSSPAQVNDLGQGPWVLIRVSDTGGGMTPDVLERVFEPFFTTKEIGKGSGLGLSQVYGFVRQSGGHIAVTSAPGRGTTFSLYLQATQAPVRRSKSEAAPEDLQGRAERILVVEDDPSVLALTVDMLSGLNYQVSTASHAQAALDLLATGEPVDLLFSDVVMPGGISGVQLARTAKQSRPEIKVLLTSGYTGEAAPAAAPEFELLDKPYDRIELARRLRRLCDAPVTGPEEAPAQAKRRGRAAKG